MRLAMKIFSSGPRSKIEETMLMNNSDYLSVVEEIKARIHAARRKVLLSANSDMVLLYWDIGYIINERSVWGN